MKLTFLGIIVVVVAIVTLQTVTAQAPSEPIKVRGCLMGNGSDQNPWSLHRVVIPPPPGVTAPRGGGRGGDGRGAPPAAAAPAPPSQPPLDLRLTGVDMTPWRNMFVEVEGTLGPRPASGLREFKVESARSAYGDCR
jgi:hypothetical protein